MHRVTAVVMVVLFSASARPSEKTIASLMDFRSAELKYSGLELSRSTKIRLVGRGGGGEKRWTYGSNKLFAYGWIINADTRNLVWVMDQSNTRTDGDDRKLDEELTLEKGSYEVYFSAPTFSYHSTLSHIQMNVDHRNVPLFGRNGKNDFLSYFLGWWTEDMEEEWKRRAEKWGLELLVDDGVASSISKFIPPKAGKNVLLQRVGVGESEHFRLGFEIEKPAAIDIYGLGELVDKKTLVDFGSIVDISSRRRIWEMSAENTDYAGGGKKNVLARKEIRFSPGKYVLYYHTDDSHSSLDWNDAPPYDPLNYGITLSAKNERDRSSFKEIPYDEKKDIIVSLTRIRDGEERSEGFSLKQDTQLRVYAFGERGSSRRQLADHGFILDGRSRRKVWQMDADRVLYAGGASKNCYLDEVIKLPRGSYIVTYISDDSHSYEDWNSHAPFDPEFYGISVMGAGDSFSPSIVGKYVEERDKNVIAQLIRVGDDKNVSEPFSLERTTRLRLYALGEGQKHEMYDYGWIVDAQTGTVKWEMTYGMTTFAGGNRKNRLVNTSLILDKGNYVLHYKSDDSHSYNNWNVDSPEDTEYWGITLYNDDEGARPAPPAPPQRP